METKLEIPEIPTEEQLKRILLMAFGPLADDNPLKGKFTSDICHLLQNSPEMMEVIRRWQATADEPVQLKTVGSIFTGGFITGYLLAFAMMKLEAN